MSAVMPGARALADVSPSASWQQARTRVAELWARRGAEHDSDPTAEAIEQAEQELDHLWRQALVAGSGSAADGLERMQVFWAGCLVTAQMARPELADVISALPQLLGAAAPIARKMAVHNTISGTVRGTAVQAGDIHGNITFER